MRKHWKLTLIALAAVLVLTMALTTNVFAQEEASTTQGPLQTFISKVATILGIDEAQVTAAVEQAAQETRDEMVQQGLQKAVDNGNLTEEQATEIQEWWESRPEALQQPGALGRFGMMKAWQRSCCRGWAGGQQRLLDQVFDENITGTIVDIDKDAGTITLKTADNTEVTVEYTSKTNFILQGVSAVEAGQTATASCWSDADGNLTAKIVRVNLA